MRAFTHTHTTRVYKKRCTHRFLSSMSVLEKTCLIILGLGGVVETRGRTGSHLRGFAAVVPWEPPRVALKSPPASCCCALVVHSTLHRPSLCSVSSLAHRSHIPSPHCHCKNCCCTPLQPTNVLVDYALFARSKEKANVTLKVIHHGTVL